ncbi:8-amino-7-oxononanoate synthase [Parasphingorhabdus cellanae]|uniref:8-amino-7-oxononanoate synthase n=1 Tax=Parasphingorhabdus cellanae TaxID=2806553 RepID=A0ABX7T2J2_9SPHN|nr:8-amino-7-oxononanoate synthase [Parasphingorhabdus cellanae]QTD54767.1 8-amino-7-oxononanoate synthase [Parasphingorhabdus cellanae]
MSRFEPFHQQLDALDRAGRKRTLIGLPGKDFSSNDYLGLARSPFLKTAAHAALDKGIAHGSGGSRLLAGNHPEHEALEAFAASHYGAEAALFFSTGYAANLALFSTLPQTDDLVLYDDLIHASSHDGMKLGRAETQSFRHNDLNDLQSQIATYRHSGGTGMVWIAVESLYSMDGDQAPLVDIADIANANDAVLIIDEAHAVGVFGTGGVGLSGSLENQDNAIVLRTCGKAMGVEGGLITMPSVLRDFFINRARAFIFSTAPSPLTAHLVHKAIEYIATKPSLQTQLHNNIAVAEHRLGALCPASRAGSQIFPVIIGDDSAAVQIAASLQQRGFDVRAIRPPTVPAGTARLRLSLTLNVLQEDIISLADALTEAQNREYAA